MSPSDSGAGSQHVQPVWHGQVSAISIAQAADEPMRMIDEAHLIAGRGIEGDRYYFGTGTHSMPENAGEPGYQVTLIESETIEAIRREKGLDLDAGSTRRNIVTRGFALNHLVHRTFRIGSVTLRGIALCEPCPHLGELIGHQLMVSLIHRGGLGAQIVSSGTIRVGDVIEAVPVASVHEEIHDRLRFEKGE